MCVCVCVCACACECICSTLYLLILLNHLITVLHSSSVSCTVGKYWLEVQCEQIPNISIKASEPITVGAYVYLCVVVGTAVSACV